MIQISDEQRRAAFRLWLRTGRLPSVNNPDDVELKFNPWHDPEDGRFTFAGAGRYFGQGHGDSGGHGSAAAPSSLRRGPATSRHRPSSGANAGGGNASLPSSSSTQSGGQRRSPSDGSWRGGGFTGGGGGSFGGAGATSTAPWSDPSSPPRRPSGSGTTNGGTEPPEHRRPAAPGREQFGTKTSNGYNYEIDAAGRTRRISGSLTVADKHVRSRSAQARAGGADRRPTDDGGHYIAARFNGPTDAFNHFAQDANFNRGDYRVLEDDWGRAKRAGKKVTVKIVPVYVGISKRPAAINVWFTIDGRLGSQQFSNEPREKRRAK